MGFWSSLRGKEAHTEQEEYLEIEGGQTDGGSKVAVRPCMLNDYEDIKGILDMLRKGNQIVLLNISPLKEKDIVELKRAINKLKKTTDAVGGQVAGFGDDTIIATPKSVVIHRAGTSSVY